VSDIETNTGTQGFSGTPDLSEADDVGLTDLSADEQEEIPVRPARAIREGLPASYRMRADSHYVEQLSAGPSTLAVRLVPLRDIDPVDPPPSLDIEPLVRSIRAHGVLHPLLVRAERGRYRVIAGRKRLLASQAAGLPAVPCFVHHVEGADAESLSAADNLRCASVREADERPSGNAAVMLRHLASHLAVIRSSQPLVGEAARSMEQRVALDLIQAHTARAAWLIAATELVAGGRPRGLATKKRRALGPVVEDLVEQFGPESRLTGVALNTQIDERAYATQLDAESCTVGITGALVALVALMDHSAPDGMAIAATRPSADTVVVTVGRVHVAQNPALERRFFDAAFTERPGDWPALMGALAAKAAAERHGGTASFDVDRDRGAAIRFVLPTVV